MRACVRACVRVSVCLFVCLPLCVRFSVCHEEALSIIESVNRFHLGDAGCCKSSKWPCPLFTQSKWFDSCPQTDRKRLISLGQMDQYQSVLRLGLHEIVLDVIVLHEIVLHVTVLHEIVLHLTVLHVIVLHVIVLHEIVLHVIVGLL